MTLQTLDARHLWHPYTQHRGADDNIVIDRAEGAYIYDCDGRPILDAISSWWVTLHGHGHPAIAKAIGVQAKTLEQVIFAGFTHEPAVRLAEGLVRIAPKGLSRVFYTDDGSTAVEVAIKMAVQYWANRGETRRKIVALEHAYHGDTVGAMSASARSVFTAAFDPLLFEVLRLPDPTLVDPAGALEALCEHRGNSIAAVIVEPMLLGAGGMKVWSSDALAKLRAMTAKHGILLIADEVLTGFGRTGPLFACDHARISPDVMCLSKGITGGFLPLGATLATEQIFEAFLSDDRARTLFHGHSYTANPIACAAALASLSLLDDDCASRRAAIEASHRAWVDRIASHSRLRNARVLGTMVAVDLVAEGGYLDPIGLELRRFALERGVLLRPLGNTVYLLPPYCVAREDLAKAYRVIEQFVGR